MADNNHESCNRIPDIGRCNKRKENGTCPAKKQGKKCISPNAIKQTVATARQFGYLIHAGCGGVSINA